MQSILTELTEGILLVTINRGDKMNALNADVFTELDTTMDKVYTDAAIRGVIITGTGAKAFAAGADIAEFQTLDKDGGKALSIRGQKVFDKIEHCPKPVIAAVNGFALGGGCELAMACHIRIAADNAKFGQPEVNLGLIPGYAGTQRLTRYVGKARAIELLLTADMINAEQALTYGLVNYVVPQAELLDKCRAILNKVKTKSPLNVAQVITLVNAHYDKTQNGAALESEEFGNCFATDDKKEGVAAFLEKRAAVFTGK